MNIDTNDALLLVRGSGKSLKKLESESGVNRSAISRWFNGIRGLSPGSVTKLLEAVGHPAISLGHRYDLVPKADKTPGRRK